MLHGAFNSWYWDHGWGRDYFTCTPIASRVVVYEELKEAATVSLGKVGLRHQQNQEHHDDHQEHHYGTGRTR